MVNSGANNSKRKLDESTSSLPPESGEDNDNQVAVDPGNDGSQLSELSETKRQKLCEEHDNEAVSGAGDLQSQDNLMDVAMASIDDDGNDDGDGSELNLGADTEDLQEVDLAIVEASLGNQKDDKSYKVLSPQEICQHMTSSIEQTNNVLQLPNTTMRMILNHFGWNSEKLMEAYYDNDQEKFFKDAEVVNPFVEQICEATADNPNKCQICDEEVDKSVMFSLATCNNHRFCTPCWTQYITMKIVDEGMGQTISCAAHNCPILVDDATVMQLITDPNVIQKYQQLITNNFVQCNRLMRWCPSPDCNKAVLVESTSQGPVTCSCSFTFCFQCGHKDHDPLKCVWLKKWLKKCADDSETANWISANTKECPNGNCSATIEKNGGCNHMLCRKCGHQFCWVCMGPWNIHGNQWYNCGRYDSNAAEAARASQDKSRASLHRYLFYFNRYENHMQSLKFENKLYESIQEKKEEMQRYFQMTWIEVQFLDKAVDVLCQCRQTLMYTYAFAFYLEPNNQTAIFEDNQKDLESATETLSEYLERDITVANMADIQQRVQDKTRYCEQRRNVLLNHVHEGYEKRSWIFKEKETD